MLNVVLLHAPKKPIKNKLVLEIFGALLLAVLTFFLMKFLPENISRTIAEGIITPVFLKMTNIIAEIATPLVFLAVVTGITGMGKPSVIGKIGKKLFGWMLFTYGVAAVAFSAFASFIFPVAQSHAVSRLGMLKELTQLVLDMVPDHFLSSFVVDNDLQVIVVAIFVGMALLTLGEKGEKLNELLNMLSDVVNKMMMIACKLLPLIVYFRALNLALQKTENLKQLYLVGIIFALSCLCIIVSV